MIFKEFVREVNREENAISNAKVYKFINQARIPPTEKIHLLCKCFLIQNRSVGDELPPNLFDAHVFLTARFVLSITGPKK